MLSFSFSGRRPYCDGLRRRNFLDLGAIGFGGLALPDLLRAETAAGIGSSSKALVGRTTSVDPYGRPQDLVDRREPIRELI